MLPVESPFAVALMEVAAELGLPRMSEPHGLRTAIVKHDCDRQSEIRQLESTIVIRNMRISHLEGELTAAVSDCNEWSARALKAERHLIEAVVLLVAVGCVLVIVAGSRVGWGVL
jgi:hypothetical protein